MTIFLVGMPGSGKTTVGKLLALRLGWPFLDTDRALEEVYNTSIQWVFESSGEAHFRQMEYDFITRFKETNIVVSTGGGLPCFHNLMASLNVKGTTICIERNLLQIAESMHMNSHRPLIQQHDVQSIMTSLEHINAQRASCYSAAHFTINNDGQMNNTVNTILEVLNV